MTKAAEKIADYEREIEEKDKIIEELRADNQKLADAYLALHKQDEPVNDNEEEVATEESPNDSWDDIKTMGKIYGILGGAILAYFALIFIAGSLLRK